MPDNAKPSTSLSLLAKDAIVRVTFGAVLNSEQYAELLQVATRTDTSAATLTAELTDLGKRWKIPTTVRRVR